MLRVHFASLDMQTGAACHQQLCDAVYVYDRDGNLYARLGGRQTDLDGPMVPGDRVTVRWVTDSDGDSPGLVIDRVDWLAGAAATPDAGVIVTPPPDARVPGGSGGGDPEGGCAVGGGASWLAAVALALLVAYGRRRR
jgi:hypothetical protein